MKNFLLIVLLSLITPGCASAPPPKLFEIGAVCAQPKGTDVIVTGYFSLPKQLEITKYTRNGQAVGNNYRLILLDKLDATGDSVPVVVPGTNIPMANSIRNLPERYNRNDLIVFTNDHKESLPAQKVKITGRTLDDSDAGCKINVLKIEKAI